MNLTSNAFNHQGFIPSKYTCDGENINPALKITDVPSEAKSLVLIMDDPDVPTSIRADGMWDHWIVFNIPPNTTEIAENKEPVGVHGVGTSGNAKYHGPCPPDREHRYFFKLFALDSLLELPVGTGKNEVEHAMTGHVIDQVDLIGRYCRK